MTDRSPTAAEEETEALGLHIRSPDDIATEKAQAERAELRKAMLVNLMRNEGFREWLMEILVGFNTFGRTFAASPTGFPDAAATEFHLGLKAAGWFLWEIFDAASPEMASLMRREAGKGSR